MKASAPMGGWMAGLRTDVEGVPNLPMGLFTLQDPSRTPLAPDRSPNTAAAKRKESVMNSKPNSMSTPLHRRIGPALLTLVATLASALTVPARAGTQPTAIPFSDIGARATAHYQGEA